MSLNPLTTGYFSVLVPRFGILLKNKNMFIINAILRGKIAFLYKVTSIYLKSTWAKPLFSTLFSSLKVKLKNISIKDYRTFLLALSALVFWDNEPENIQN